MLKTWAKAITVVTALQIILGGIMSGAKAGLFYPSWPDMNGEWIPSVLLEGGMWNVENFVNYDGTVFLSALVQFTHRSTAYILTIIVLCFVWQLLKRTEIRIIRLSAYMLVSMLIIQVILGILTVINSEGMIPVGLGVLHQAGAIFLLSTVLFVDYQLIRK